MQHFNSPSPIGTVKLLFISEQVLPSPRHTPHLSSDAIESILKSHPRCWKKE